MKEIIGKLNKIFESRIRLGIMSTLMVQDWIDFKSLKQELEITDGNLASHLNALEKHNYIEVSKGFIGRKPNTKYKATETGREAFQRHLDQLEQLLNSNRNT